MIDLTGEVLEAWNESWIDVVGEVDVKVLSLTWNWDDTLLCSQDLLDDL